MGSLLVHGATLVDGTGRDPVRGAAMRVEGERITWVGKAEMAPSADRTVDASGLWLTPGLIDPHSHVSFNGTQRVEENIAEPRDLLLLRAITTLRRSLESGLTSLRDVGGWQHIDTSLKRGLMEGIYPGPRLQVAGQILCMTGGHAHFIGLEVDGVDGVRRAARQQIKMGADWVKLMATGGAATPGQDVMATQYTEEELAVAAAEAHRAGKRTATHCHGTGGILASIRAGIDTIEHATFMTEEATALAKERGTSLVFTLGTGRGGGPPNPDWERRTAPMKKAVVESVQMALRAGVRVALGTDAGGNPYSPHAEFHAYLENAQKRTGMTAMQVLVAATRAPAELMGWGDRLGTLEPGKLADFLLLEADPLESPAAFGRLRAVYQGGRVVPRSTAVS